MILQKSSSYFKETPVRRIAPFLFLFTGLTGCAGNDLIVQRQSSLEGRLEQVMQAHNSAKAELTAANVQIHELKEQSLKRVIAEKELQLQYDALQGRVKILSNRLAQLEASTRQSATIELVNQESIAAGREESVQAAYMKAFGLFSANNYREAAEAFNSFIAAYPESEYAANARYWLGECHFSEGRYKEAIDSFTRVLEMNPPQKRSSEALLRIGMAWYRLDSGAKGAAVLRQVMEQYPGSDAAVRAKQQLDGK